MKQSVFVLCAATASASWGEWDTSNYCDFSQEEVAQEKITSEFYYSSDQCSYFCQTSDQERDDITYGTDLCCDFEQWADGSYDCTLYQVDPAGEATLVNSFENDGSGDEFQSMTFSSGEYNYTLQEYVENVKESMIDSGCDATCVDSILTADNSTFVDVAAQCGCPTYMLKYNKAQGALSLLEGDVIPGESSDDEAEEQSFEEDDESSDDEDEEQSSDDVEVELGDQTLMLQDAEAPAATEEAPAATEETTATAAPEGEEAAAGSKTPLYIGGGVGLVALIGGIVWWKKSGDSENEGGDFEKILA